MAQRVESPEEIPHPVSPPPLVLLKMSRTPTHRRLHNRHGRVWKQRVSKSLFVHPKLRHICPLKNIAIHTKKNTPFVILIMRLEIVQFLL